MKKGSDVKIRFSRQNLFLLDMTCIWLANVVYF